MNSDFDRAVLVVIDVQQAFNDARWGIRNNPQAESNVAKLLNQWRTAKRPIIHIQHSNPKPESLFNGDGLRVKPEAKPHPGEPILTKNVNSAFIGTDLQQRLESIGATKVVLVGLTTDHCVATTARMAGNFGFDTYVVSDATATFERTGVSGKHYSPEEMHDTALTSLNKEFATIVATADLTPSPSCDKA